jgi:hypothetical protein
VRNNDIPSKNRTRSILMNWRRWAADINPDYAEVHYYVISPDFAGTPFTANKGKPPPPYDPDSADKVEDVLRAMFKPYPKEYRAIQAYYGERMAQSDIAKELGITQQVFSSHRLPMAERIFAEQWAELIRK